MTNRTVSVVRGDALNPFEMQTYAKIDGYQIRAIGRSRSAYGPWDIPIPATFLSTPETVSRLGRALPRIRQRVPRLPNHEFLIGFEAAVGGSAILHAAETILPVTEQAATHCLRHAKPLLLTCWETIPFRYDDDPSLADRKTLVKNAATLYVAVTHRAEEALRCEGIPAGQIRVVPAGIDTDRFTPTPTSHDHANPLPVASDRFVILYVGRLIQEKGLVELTRAFAKAKFRNAELVFVGRGNQGDRVRRAAAAHGIADRVHVCDFVGYRSLPAVYARADLVVAPSLTTPYWEEQFGMVLAEAMASGRPLVTTRSGAIPEVVEDAAVLVEPYDVDELAEVLRALQGDPDRRAKLGAAGRELALRKYALAVVAPQLRAIYDEVLSA